MLDQRLAETMQRILSKSDSRFTLNATLERLPCDYSIGTIRGKSVYFSGSDKDEIRSLLIARNYSTEVNNLSEIPRHERLSLTPNEKAGGEAVKKNRISIKALECCSVNLGERALYLPPESHLDVRWDSIADAVSHNCIMVVENYENFNLIHKTKFQLPECYNCPLVVYRGDATESRFDNVKKFLEYVKLPVLAFVDVDLASIVIASNLPNIVGMVTPQADELDRQLSDGSARKDLFYNQHPVYASTLESLTNTHCCYQIWKLVSKHKACVVQERWINNGSVCSIFLPK